MTIEVFQPCGVVAKSYSECSNFKKQENRFLYLLHHISKKSHFQENMKSEYRNAIRDALQKALNLRNFPSQVSERHNKPEVSTLAICHTFKLHYIFLMVSFIDRGIHQRTSYPASDNNFRFREVLHRIVHQFSKSFYPFQVRRS